jgi:hypothetical protein
MGMKKKLLKSMNIQQMVAKQRKINIDNRTGKRVVSMKPEQKKAVLASDRLRTYYDTTYNQPVIVNKDDRKRMKLFDLLLSVGLEGLFLVAAVWFWYIAFSNGWPPTDMLAIGAASIFTGVALLAAWLGSRMQHGKSTIDTGKAAEVLASAIKK